MLIRSINSHAPLHRTERSIIPLSTILDLKAYSPNPNSNPAVPPLSQPDQAQTHSQSTLSEPSSHPHPPIPHAHPPKAHNTTISTTIVPLAPLSPTSFAQLLKNIQLLLWAPETLFPGEGESRIPEVLRLKGIVWNEEEGAEVKGWVIQGVRGVYEVEEIKEGDSDPGGRGKVVVVGRGLEGVGAKLWEEKAQGAGEGEP